MKIGLSSRGCLSKMASPSGHAMIKDRMKIPDPTAHADPVVLNHQELEQIAGAALLVARRLMETGSRAEVVHEVLLWWHAGWGASR